LKTPRWFINLPVRRQRLIELRPHRDGLAEWYKKRMERGTLATIDLANATVVTNTTAVGAVIAVGLSSGGERLYALTQDDQGRRHVLLLEPRTLAIAARSAPLDFDPHGIVAVKAKG
jgi:hypothetical protein